MNINSKEMKKLYILTILLLAAACVKGPEYPSIDGVGVESIDGERFSGVVECTYEADSFVAKVLASGSFTATIDENAEWLNFEQDRGSRTIVANGDTEIRFAYDINRGVPREAQVTFVCGTNSCTMTVSQDGLIENDFQLQSKSVSYGHEGGLMSVLVSTKMKNEDLVFSVVYEEEESAEWMSGICLRGNFLCFELLPNYSTSLIRHAVVTITHKYGAAQLRITQFCEGTAVEEVSVDQIKNNYQPGRIEKHIVLKGIAINDWHENNGGEIKTVSIDSPDPTWQERVLYLQNEEGTQGIKLVFEQSCRSVIDRFNEVTVDLYGLDLVLEHSPERYSISNIPLSAIVESASGKSVEPEEKTIAGLSDEDLYTYIKLVDVEIPIRKGCYVPVDIRYIGSIMTYPMVLHDVDGNQSHMMVNANCTWSRNGKEMPHGKGTVAGVLVHEYCDNFEWDKTKEAQLSNAGLMTDYISGIGRIGDYQIRPVTQEDIKLEKAIEDSFSEILCEWAYCDSLGVNLVKNYDTKSGVMYPTYTTLQDTTGLNARFYCADAGGKVRIGLCNDFTHLGPYEYGKTITQPENGNGIYDAYGRPAHHWFDPASVSTIGVIYSDKTNPDKTNGSAWQVAGWSVEKYWCAEFSTKGVQSALSVQVGTMGCIDGYGAPRYWVLECSTDGISWKEVAKYTVPDFSYAVPKRFFQLPGTKYMSFDLPSDLTNQDKVYVRLRPENQSSGNASSYDGGKTINAQRYNAINYFAVRYNK